MSEYQWPDPATRPLLGKRISRVDGPVKVSGRAKYTYDYNPDGLLAGKILRCPYAHARITSIDTSAAEKMAGVKAVKSHCSSRERKSSGRAMKSSRLRPSMNRPPKMRSAPSRCSTKCCLTLSPTPSRRRTSPSTTGPISRDDFEDMEDNQVPDDQVIAAIKKNGISFKPDEKYLKDAQAVRRRSQGSAGAALRQVRRGKGFTLSVQEDRRADAGRARQGIRFGGSRFRRSLRRVLHHALLPGNSRHGVGMA